MLNFLIDRKLASKGFEARRVRTSDAEIHYYEAAGDPSKTPLIFVHGVGSRAGHFHDVLPNVAKAGHPVIAIDLPWHGRSSPLRRPMNSDSIFETLQETLNSIAPSRFVLIGNSLGGGLSMRYAAAHPDRIAGLVLASPAVGFTTEEDWQEMKSLLTIETREQCMRFLKRVFHRPPFYLPLIVHTFKDAITKPGVRELINSTEFSNFTLPPGFTVYPGKTLVIWGQQETLFPRRNLDWLLSNLPKDIELDQPENIGHCPHFDAPNWFAHRVLEFAKKMG